MMTVAELMKLLETAGGRTSTIPVVFFNREETEGSSYYEIEMGKIGRNDDGVVCFVLED